MTPLSPAVREVQRRLAFDTPYWAGGVRRARDGGMVLPGPGEFDGCAKIVNKQRQLVPAIARPWQWEFDEALEAQRAAGLPMRAIVLKARKLGYSTWICLKFLQRVTQQLYQVATVCAQDVNTAGIIHNMAKTAYSHLPAEDELGLGFSIKPALIGAHFTATGRKYMEFGEPSRKLRMEGRSGSSTFNIDTAASPEAGRGDTINLLHLSEVAQWLGEQASRKMLSLLNAVPYEPETIVVLESTANGMNHFHRRWLSACEGAEDPDTGEVYTAIFTPWWRDPACMSPFSTVEQRERFVASIGDESAYGEVAEDENMLVELYALSPEQLRWRRMMIRTQHENNVQLFHQENPACVTFETRVSTEQGIIEVGRADTARYTESGPIARWWPQASSPVWRLTTRQGRVLRGTADHPIQTDKGATWLAELEPGARIELRAPRFAENECILRWDGPLGLRHTLPVDEHLGRWLGYFMGDGSWYRGGLSFALDHKDGDVVDDVAALTTGLIASPHRRVIAKVKGRKGMIELRVGAKGAESLMRRLGCVAPPPSGGSLRREVCVPDVIWRSPQPVVREFLRALFECDGSASNGCVRWGSSKIQFARDVQLLLLGFGLNAVMSTTEKTAGNGNTYTFCALQLGGDAARAFHDRIGFIGVRKRSARPAAPETAVGRWCVGLRMEDEVLSIELDGEEVTYDFTIDNDEHLFMANGVLTHNSAEEAFIGSGRTVFSGILVAKAINAAESAPEAVQGSLRASGWETRRSRAGTIEVPTGAVWVPSGEMGQGVQVLDVWEHPRAAGDEPPARQVPQLPTSASSVALLEAAAARAAVEQAEKVEIVGEGAYVIAVDVAEGEANTFTEGDYHCVQVFDHHSLQQVAVYESRIDVHELPLWVLLIALYYNRGWLAVEVNGPGIAVADPLHKDYRYPKMYRRKRIDRLSQEVEKKPGWATDKVSKPAMEATFGSALQEGTHGLRDLRTARQLSTYVIDDRGRHGAVHGEHDDRLMACMIAHRVIETVRAPRPGGARKLREPTDPVTGY